MEGILSRRIHHVDQCEEIWKLGEIPLLVDEEGTAIRTLKPDAVIDGILAKKNMGTSREMAPVTIALGPGFLAGADADYVIETKRGHDLAGSSRKAGQSQIQGFQVKSAVMEESG